MKEAQIIPLLDVLGRHPARLEALIADLVRRDLLSLEEVEMHPISTFARNYSFDVDKAAIKEYPDGKMLRLQTHREGLYDQLPTGIFHRPEPYYPGQKLGARLEESRAAREREEAARQFFAPIEQEFFFTAIKAELRERELTDAFSSPLRHNLLLEIWSHCAHVPARSLPLLSYVLPLSHRIAGDLELMAACYRAVLLAPVSLAYVTGERNVDLTANTIRSGDRLGVDFNLGGTPIADLPLLEVGIGPLSRNRCEEFLPGASGTELLTLLNDCLVPYEVDVMPILKFASGAATMRLVDEQGQGSRLGFTSRLTRRA